ncbi:MAG: copper amine oxidase N-terminal domain-containing protein [Lachnospiraceae bacterium]|nr:copper amine oxidase N-terminal domain-containing protein [Lachnospiraceae bacterium]
MKKLNLRSFFAGLLTATLLFAVITTALATSGSITYNGINLTVDGKTILSKGEYLELASGEKVPSSILYVDQAGGGTTYLPMRYLAELLGMSVTWDQATGTADLKNRQTVVEPDQLMQELAEKWLVDGDYPKNDKGETYGPEILFDIVGHMPDLISTTATNGKDGYLRNSELEALLSSFDEQRSNKLPVYDLEGNVIGEFTFEDGPA